jgi:hypothetical protein
MARVTVKDGNALIGDALAGRQDHALPVVKYGRADVIEVRNPPAPRAGPIWIARIRQALWVRGWVVRSHSYRIASDLEGHWRTHRASGQEPHGYQKVSTPPGRVDRPSPRHSSVQVANTASMAPAASLRDRLRHPLTRRPLPRDSAPIGEMAGTRTWGAQEEAALPTCHYRVISTGCEGCPTVTHGQAEAQLSHRRSVDHGDSRARGQLLLACC